MNKICCLPVLFFVCLATASCSKKHVSGKARRAEKNTAVSKGEVNDSLAAKKAVFKPKKSDIIPKMIVVNDSVARTSVDGRLYYDLLGHRYWKNYKDGKYYLFNKSMYSNSDFRKPE